MDQTRKHINTDRHDFNKDLPVSIKDLPLQPFEMFQTWLQEAIDKGEAEPYAMTVSTVDSLGNPHSRVVYVRDFIKDGLVFFTNYNSQKGEDIKANAKVAIVFFWAGLQKQVRIEGRVVKVDPIVSDNYFNKRPRQSKIGAWASNQSRTLFSRDRLLEQTKIIEERFNGIEVPRPEFWGGYLIKPNYYEFWIGQPSRLHDRICYEIVNDTWEKYKLNP